MAIVPQNTKGYTVMAIKIKLTKSLIGRKDSHIATANSLGLKKIGDETTQPDNDATKGKIRHISYLVKVSAE